VASVAFLALSPQPPESREELVRGRGGLPGTKLKKRARLAVGRRFSPKIYNDLWPNANALFCTRAMIRGLHLSVRSREMDAALT
jgi:hypothetical protein